MPIIAKRSLLCSGIEGSLAAAVDMLLRIGVYPEPRKGGADGGTSLYFAAMAGHDAI